PGRDNVVITYTTPEAGHISLKVYSIDGRLVRIIENGFKNAGRYKLDCSLRDLNSGIFIVQLETERQNVNRSIIVAK
ncbi:MAG: T9SS type A sorting domain-containing protein, partial [candidate division WOR-3 bacterium]